MGLHISDIRDNYDKGLYSVSHYAEFKDMLDLVKLPSNHVFDEELSVKRNREMVEEYNQDIENKRKIKLEKQTELDKQLTDDVVEYIKEYYELTDRQARIVEGWVYREKHAFMCDYFSSIDTFAELADLLVNIEAE